MNETDKYLIMDYTNSPPDQYPKMTIAYSVKDLLMFIDQAKAREAKIAVFRVGSCLLDWS